MGRHLQADALCLEHAADAVHLQTHHIGYFTLREREEHDGLVDAVEEFRTDGLLEHLHHLCACLVENLLAVVVVDFLHLTLDILAAQVGRHDNDGVLEVHRAPLVVGQPAIVEHLQEDVEHVGMSLLYLIEKHHGVGLASHCLGELATLVVAHISRRGTDEA